MIICVRFAEIKPNNVSVQQGNYACYAVSMHPMVLSIFNKTHSGMFIIFQPLLGFLTFYYLTHRVNKLGSPGVLGWWYLWSRQYKFLYLFICLFCLAQFPLLTIFPSLFSCLGDLSCGRETDLSWVKINTVRVSVAVVKDMPKPDDWVASELSNNVCDLLKQINRFSFNIK